MEQIDRPFCPDPQVLGAFVEGTLARSEVTGVRDHLATCNDCLEDVSEAAAQHRDAPVVLARPRQRPWVLAAAGIALAVIGGGLWYRQSTSDPVNELRSVKTQYRYVEPRLTGFPHADYYHPRGGSESHPIDKLTSAIWGVRASYPEPDSAKAKHAVGLTFLIAPPGDSARNQEQAMKDLGAAAAAAPDDPKILNDYAAALYVNGQQQQALAAVDRALKIKPNFPEALYNRALILADTPQGEAAWQAYLKVDPDSPWVKEFEYRHRSP
jgi:tetratricopeptide (TPR) repeat protein